LQFSTSTEVPSLVSFALTATSTQEQFIRVLFQNTQTKSLLRLSEFLETFGVKTTTTSSKEFLERIDPLATLFIYFSKKGEGRFGFVAKVREGTGFGDLIKNWEVNMAKDLSPLLSLVSGKELEFVDSFRTASAKGVEFRYLDSNQPNFGICYSLVKGYFLFTTSGESMIKLINLMYEEKI
jgi:hypothetical protein